MLLNAKLRDTPAYNFVTDLPQDGGVKLAHDMHENMRKYRLSVVYFCLFGIIPTTAIVVGGF